jgi:hypothetical protein
MCPAYIEAAHRPPAKMRSADRVHNKLSRSERLHVYWVSRSRLSTVASSAHSAPLHHDRQDRLIPDSRFLRRAISLPSRHHRPDDSRHLVSQGDRSQLDRFAGDDSSQPAVGEILSAA